MKVASGFYDVDPAAIDGLVMVFDASNGAPAAFLLDGGFITDLRTGAAGGVAARHLAPERVEVVAVIGTGAQARHQVEALGQVRPGLAQVRVWGRDPDRAAACADDLRSPRRRIVRGHRRRERRGSRRGRRRRHHLHRRARAVGPSATCSLRARTSPRSAPTVPASRNSTRRSFDAPTSWWSTPLDQCLALGELQHAPEQAERAVELGRICAGEHPGRTGEGQLTVCDLTGLGVQDVAAANVVMARAGDRGDTLAL